MDYVLDNIKQRIKEHEGCKLIAYVDTRGYLTIGWGHQILASDGLRENDTISQQHADDLFEHDFAWILTGIKQLVPMFDRLPEPIKIVLCDMAFNNGILGLKKFKRFLHYVNLELWLEAASEIKDSANYRSQDLHSRYAELAMMVQNTANGVIA